MSGLAANAEIVRRALDAYSRRDIDALRPLTLPGIELDWTASVGTLAAVYRGFDEVVRFYGEYYDVFQSTVIEPERIIEQGDVVVVPNIAYQRGRDGIEVNARSTLVFTLSDRRIARVCLYQHEDEALKAVGLAN